MDTIITYTDFITMANDYATDIAQELWDEHGDIDECQDAMHDKIHEWIDSSEHVIYYAKAKALYDNAGQYDEAWQDAYGNEDLGALIAEKGLDQAYCVFAYFALSQAVAELVQDALEELDED